MIFALAPAAALLVCVMVHVLVSRAAPGFSRLSAVALSVLAGFAAVVGLAALQPREAEGLVVNLSITVAWSLAYLAFAYTYVFGFFNLSESARRVRLLIELRAAGRRGLTRNELLAAYNARMIVEARLRRMLGAAQISKQDDRYVIRQSLMLRIAKILVMGKRLLLGAESEFGVGPGCR